MGAKNVTFVFISKHIRIHISIIFTSLQFGEKRRRKKNPFCSSYLFSIRKGIKWRQKDIDKGKKISFSLFKALNLLSEESSQGSEGEKMVKWECKIRKASDILKGSTWSDKLHACTIKIFFGVCVCVEANSTLSLFSLPSHEANKI